VFVRSRRLSTPLKGVDNFDMASRSHYDYVDQINNTRVRLNIGIFQGGMDSPEYCLPRTRQVRNEIYEGIPRSIRL